MLRQSCCHYQGQHQYHWQFAKCDHQLSGEGPEDWEDRLQHSEYDTREAQRGPSHHLHCATSNVGCLHQQLCLRMIDLWFLFYCPCMWWKSIWRDANWCTRINYYTWIDSLTRKTIRVLEWWNKSPLERDSHNSFVFVWVGKYAIDIHDATWIMCCKKSMKEPIPKGFLPQYIKNLCASDWYHRWFWKAMQEQCYVRQKTW